MKITASQKYNNVRKRFLTHDCWLNRHYVHTFSFGRVSSVVVLPATKNKTNIHLRYSLLIGGRGLESISGHDYVVTFVRCLPVEVCWVRMRATDCRRRKLRTSAQPQTSMQHLLAISDHLLQMPFESDRVACLHLNKKEKKLTLWQAIHWSLTNRLQCWRHFFPWSFRLERTCNRTSSLRVASFD